MTSDEILARLQRQCARMEYCSRDVYRKAIKALEGDVQAAERMVEALREDRFVDDARYAAAFAREKSALQGWGPAKISAQLRLKGIPDEIVRAALEEIDRRKASDKLEKAVAAKYRSLKEDPYCRFKLLKFALGRGFGYDEAQQAVERVLAGITD